MSTTQPLLRVSTVRKSFAGVVAVDGASLEVGFQLGGGSVGVGELAASHQGKSRREVIGRSRDSRR